MLPNITLNSVSSKDLLSVNITSQFPIEFVHVKGSIFTMGDNDINIFKEEYREHPVVLTDYYISIYPVSNELYQLIMRCNLPEYEDGDCPVSCVSWNDAQEFIQKLNLISNDSSLFSLPTEAQWEFAAKGGILSKNYKYSGSNEVDSVAWCEGLQEDTEEYGTKPVGKKKPNELGIYDMTGNVWEWCNDWYDKYPINSQVNPTGPSNGKYKVLRGGSYSVYPDNCLNVARHYDLPFASYEDYGFRLVKCK